MLSKLRTILACTITAIAVAAIPRIPAQTFSNPLRIPTAVDPSSILVGDLNGDGRPDIVWGDISATPYVLHVLLAQPGGGYLPAPNITLPAQTFTACQMGDFNLDGHLDVVCGAGVNYIAVQMFLGNGDGTFQPAIGSYLQSSLSGDPLIFASGDLNGDGFPDLIVYFAQGAANLVFLGNGKGSFTLSLGLNGGYNGYNFPIVADLNGDGKPDLFLPVGPAVQFGKGDGTFTPFVTYKGSSYAGAVCMLHDMDGDGHPDAVCGAQGVIENNVGIEATQLVILHGNPDGSFNTSPIASSIFGDGNTVHDGVGTFDTPFYVADINRDGVLDILADSDDGNAVLLGGPALAFSTPLHYAQPSNNNSNPQYASAVADMNGDGIPDIVVAGPNGIYITYGRPNGTLASAFAPEVTEVIAYATVADFNGDGIPDIAANGDTALKLSLGKGDGTFATPVALPNNNGAINFSTLAVSPGGYGILHGDFNGDGKQDIIAIGGASTTTPYIFFGHGDGTFAAPLAVPSTSTVFPLSSALIHTSVADINHDGRDDLLFMSSGYSQTAKIASAVSNGDGTFNTVTTAVASDPNGNGYTYPNSQPALADFNRDGKLDAVYGALNNAYVVLGNGDGTFASTGIALPIPTVTGQIIAGVVAVATGDFDGDGNQDFVALVQYNSATYPFGGAPYPDQTTAWVFYGSGNGTFSSAVSAGTFNRNYTGIAAADLNLDGLTDIVLKTNGSLGNGEYVGVVDARSGRTFGPAIPYVANAGLSTLAITDLNGDGFPDLVFANGDYNIWASSVTVLLNLGGNPPTLSTALYATPSPLSSPPPSTSPPPSPPPPPAPSSPARSASPSTAPPSAPPRSPPTPPPSPAPPTSPWEPTNSPPHGPATPPSPPSPSRRPMSSPATPPPPPSPAPPTPSTSTAATSPPPPSPRPTAPPRAPSTSPTTAPLLPLYPSPTAPTGPSTSPRPWVPTPSARPTSQPAPSPQARPPAASLSPSPPTTITLTSSLNPSAVGQSVTFTATVTYAGPLPILAGAASITISDGATPLQTIPIPSPPGTSTTIAATYSTTALAVGSHTITATLNPPPNYASSSASLTQIVNGLATTSVLTATPTTAPFGSPITLTATVAPATKPGPTTPTGTVTFYNGSSAIGSAPLSAAAIATLVTSTLPVGTDTVTCLYSGDSVYNSSPCNIIPVVITITSTALTLTSSANPSPALTPITFTAHLTANGQPAPAGNTIALTLNGQSTNLLTDATGSAALTTPGLNPGTYPVSASFAATSSLAASSASLSQVVTALPTATTLTASPNPAYVSQTVTLTATVTASNAQIPTGSITFYDASTPLGTVTLNASAQATMTTSTLAIGTHPLNAVYTPTAPFAGSTSPIVQEVILASGFTLALSPTTITLPPGQPGTVAILLTSVGNFSGPLALTYGPLPTYATASISPSTVTLTAGGTANSMLTLNTLLKASNRPPARPGSRSLPIALAATLLLLTTTRRKRLSRLLTLLLAAALFQPLTGCVNAFYTVNVVAPGTYQVSVTATDVNHNTQTGTLTVVVIP